MMRKAGKVRNGRGGGRERGSKEAIRMWFAYERENVEMRRKRPCVPAQPGTPLGTRREPRRNGN